MSHIAHLYGLSQKSVQVLPYPQAVVIKLALDLKTVAGNPGDRGVYGTQQHGPLLGIELRAPPPARAVRRRLRLAPSAGTGGLGPARLGHPGSSAESGTDA